MAKINALYRIFDADEGLLYIGITNNPTGRMMEHVRSKPWARRICYIAFEHFASRVELEAAERIAIIAEGSEFNIAHARRWSKEIEDEIEDGWVLEEYDDTVDVYTDRSSDAAAAAVMGTLLS